MGKVFFIFVFVIISSAIYSQPGRQNYKPNIFFLNENIGWFSYLGDSTIYKTTDGGQNWIPQNYFLFNFQYMMFVSDSVGFMKFGNIIAKTTNKGETWNYLYHYLDDINHNIEFFFSNESTGYITTHYIYEYDQIGSIIFKTTNGGTKWDTIYVLPYSCATMMWVHGNDDITIYGSLDVVNDYRGLIVRPSDSIYVLFEDEGGVQGLTFIDSLYGFAKRDKYEGYYRSGVERTSDGGKSWYHDTLECDQYIFFTDSVNGFCTIKVPNSIHGAMVKTSNAGKTWERLDDYTPKETWFYAWYFLDSKNGFILTEKNYQSNFITYRTSDGGYTWKELGQIIVTSVAYKVSETFFLSQNYPNPFNPLTIIKYNLGKRAAVTLDIFDVLGNKISTLVNEEKDAGEYQVQWDASKYSSGVYFYRLTAGNFVQNRKMLLVK